MILRLGLGGREGLLAVTSTHRKSCDDMHCYILGFMKDNRNLECMLDEYRS